MTFDEILAQILDLLQRQVRISYRALKRRFEIDDEYIEDLKAEIIQAQRLAVDEDGAVLVSTGETAETPAPASQPDQTPQIDTQAAQPTQVESPPVASHVPDAERRQLTVIFCDLVESTVLSGQLDPEDLWEVVRAYQAACDEVIQRFDGYIAQYLGDGLLVYFGYPQAHEDDAQRAVRASLGIVEAIRSLNLRLEQDHGLQIAVRVGIHTGLVVVGEMGGASRQEQLALGEAPNVAARLQGLAAPDTVVISEITAQLVQGYFESERLGDQTLRGVPKPMAVYRVLRESEAQSRLDIASVLTPLVGRKQEVHLLLNRWSQAKAGQGQIVVLSGEAGIGKSRLVQVLKEHLAATSHNRLECRSSPYYQNTALYPMIDRLERALQFQREDSPEAKLDKLEQLLRQYRLVLEETVPLFAALLSLSMPEDRYPSLNWTPQRQRQKTLEAILALVFELATRQPVLFILEDLHWTDPSTLEWLGLLIDQVPTAPVLLLLTHRPEFEPPWGVRSHLTPLPLDRLTQAQIETMVECVAEGKRIPPAVMQYLVAQTDGVPLFVEEMTKALLESKVLEETQGHCQVVDHPSCPMT